ncbi:MAG: helix-turn-helix transcriptional regulator, partial [Clostridia bacterium]|nr:helix-turn-helix transcriptional regulator [Clostridia bacterium]
MRFGDNLKELRKAAGLTQEKLGEILSVSMQAVSRWETTDTLPDAA